jgi:hypothetical protein
VPGVQKFVDDVGGDEIRHQFGQLGQQGFQRISPVVGLEGEAESRRGMRPAR